MEHYYNLPREQRRGHFVGRGVLREVESEDRHGM